MMNGTRVDDLAVSLETIGIPVVPASRKRRSVLVWILVGWLAVVVVLAAAADFLPMSNYELPVGPPRQAPRLGSLDFLLGTDNFGRSIFSRVVYGARVSLLIGTIAGLTGFVIGTTLGLIGGHFGKAVDWVVTLLADAMLAFPPLILLLALASVLKPSATSILIGLALVTVPSFLRLARANTISWSSREFVRAAKNMGASNTRILTRELLPNVLPALAAYLPIVVAALMIAEGSLSFLGLGVPTPQPSWGGMVSAGTDFVETSPHLVFIPAGFLFLAVLSLSQIGDHLRQRFDRTLHD